MEYGYSVLMGFFALAILAYAALMAITKNYNILPWRAQIAVKPQDPELYMTKLAKAVALTALAPALSALVALWNGMAGMAVLIVAFIFFLWLSTKIMEDVQ